MGLRAVAVVVGGAGVAIAACWTMLAPGEVAQDQVERGTLAQVAAAPSDALHCDGGLKAEVGAGQSCVLHRGGEDFAVQLRVTDVDGDRVNWDSTVAGAPRSGQRVAVRELERRTREVLARERHVDAVTCDGALAGIVGARQSCAMTARGHRHDVTVTVTTVDPSRVQWGVTVRD
ncbi:DUF4333 domain-containing protein [Tsukamurella paurometabola]|uniref:DUF4333 domain-containing protein n=1 Tax=Tsukamurella paurometabola TaxID=2061 RepID=A0A3P8MB75_TSUPA|nr:DUF4333 domain-containing protein [Tsukamurella paurometabola]MBS4102811.1 DUF4333 domain-containing protein [Tsukamurella paurometabola]UEA85007.1 DUF4333 domain-containing protein [Tsukamurella paurometabola]VDR37606.1 Uncharacterised protein [Tsukamurella paurometabola]